MSHKHTVARFLALAGVAFFGAQASQAQVIKIDGSSTVYPITELPDLLGVSPSEIQDYLQNRGLPATGTRGGIRESELNRWVTLQNRYQLLPMGLHWMAPTPRHIPELS